MKRQEVFETLLRGIHKGECVIVSHNQNWSEVKVQHELDAGIKSAPTETYTIGQAISIIDGWEKRRVAICGTIDMSPRSGDAPMITEYVKGSDGMPVDGDISREYPIPYNTEVKLPGHWRFRFYVESTAGGGAKWEVESLDIDYDKECMQQQCGKFGQYSTLLTGIIENPAIIWASRLPGFTGGHCEKPIRVVQNFLPGFNPFTSHKILGGDSLIVRKEREVLLKLAHAHGELNWSNKEQSQGRLEYTGLIYADGLCDTGVTLSDLEELSTGFHAMIFNHQCLGGYAIDACRVGNVAYLMVQFPKAGWIVSPDFIDEPIRTMPGYYLLRHSLLRCGD